MIQFEFELWDIGFADVVADDDGANIKVYVKDTDVELPWNDLRDSDQSRIKALVSEWADHYMAMGEKPANDAFGPSYVRGLNEDMNK